VLEAADTLEERRDGGSVSCIDTRGFDAAESALGRLKAASVSPNDNHSKSVGQKTFRGRLADTRAPSEDDDTLLAHFSSSLKRLPKTLSFRRPFENDARLGKRDFLVYPVF
jgi:hypothetical protein